MTVARPSVAANPLDTPKAGTIYLCGIGRVAIGSSDPSAVYDYLNGATQRAQAQWLDDLRNSADDRARAAGLFLEGILSGRSSDPRVAQQASDELVQLAVGLVSKSTTLLDFVIGLGIGKRAGWVAERVNALEQERNALMEVIMQLNPSNDDDAWSCSRVARVNTFLAQRARLGEMGAARNAMAEQQTPDAASQSAR
jgi:hypothetical protein